MVAETVTDIAVTDGNVADPLELVTPEVVVPVEVAAEAAPVEAVAAPVPRAISEYEPDELAETPEVRGILQRRLQSERDKAIAEEQRRSDAKLQQYVARGEYADELAAAYAVDEATGAVTADRRKLGDIVGKLQSALTTQTSAQAFTALNTILPYEGLPAEARERIRVAGPDWMASYLDVIADHKATQSEPDRRKAWEAENAKDNAARAVVAEREAASAARTTAGATPGIVGGAPTSFASKREVDRAHMDGEITTAQLKQWRDSGRYAALPF